MKNYQLFITLWAIFISHALTPTISAAMGAISALVAIYWWLLDWPHMCESKKKGKMMETENQTEAESLATWLEHISVGISAQKAASELRRLHARVEDLEKDLGNAKRLASKIWAKHPEARGTIEEGTGAWMVFGQDVEAGGVSAQRVTQGQKLGAAPHLATKSEERKPLTNAQIRQIESYTDFDAIAFTRAIERAHGIGDTNGN